MKIMPILLILYDVWLLQLVHTATDKKEKKYNHSEVFELPQVKNVVIVVFVPSQKHTIQMIKKEIWLVWILMWSFGMSYNPD